MNSRYCANVMPDANRSGVTAPCFRSIIDAPLVGTGFIGSPNNSQDAQKGPHARRRPTAAREAYSLYVERAAEGANEADGPFSASCRADGGGELARDQV